MTSPPLLQELRLLYPEHSADGVPHTCPKGAKWTQDSGVEGPEAQVLDVLKIYQVKRDGFGVQGAELM